MSHTLHDWFMSVPLVCVIHSCSPCGMLEREGPVQRSNSILERDKLNVQMVLFPTVLSHTLQDQSYRPVGMLEQPVAGPGMVGPASWSTPWSTWSTPWSTVPLTSTLSKTTPTDRCWNDGAVERRQAWWWAQPASAQSVRERRGSAPCCFNVKPSSPQRHSWSAQLTTAPLSYSAVKG